MLAAAVLVARLLLNAVLLLSSCDSLLLLDAVHAALVLAISVRKLCGMPTHLALIGVKKAFPSAFKAGILVKLYRLGITGKCWRMLSNMYSTLHSCILTGQESDFSEEELEQLYYEIGTGL